MDGSENSLKEKEANKLSCNSMFQDLMEGGMNDIIRLLIKQISILIL